MPGLDILKTVIALIMCYVIGGIHFCNLISKAVAKKDLKDLGDKNPGGWNLLFNVSIYWGIIGSWLDALKGFLSYFAILLLTGSELIAIVGGCLAVLGHCYSPYQRFKGGKGVATIFGLFVGLSPWSILAFAIGFVGGLLLIKNMIWGVFIAIITPMIFLIFFLDSLVYLSLLLILLIVTPKYINHSLSMSENFKFRKEEKMKDLFTPKIR